MSVSQMFVGQMFFGLMSVGQMSVGQNDYLANEVKKGTFLNKKLKFVMSTIVDNLLV
jgi:hypothetical protein